MKKKGAPQHDFSVLPLRNRAWHRFVVFFCSSRRRHTIFDCDWSSDVCSSDLLDGGASPYALQAAIAACHMRARTAQETDWDRIVLLYDALLQINPSPIVALNRAVAVGMAQGPAAGLDALDAAATLAGDAALAGYHLFPSVRGDLLMKMGRLAEAREEIRRAIAMTQNLRERELLTNRLKQLGQGALSA